MVSRPVLNPLSHTSQGKDFILKIRTARPMWKFVTSHIGFSGGAVTFFAVASLKVTNSCSGGFCPVHTWIIREPWASVILGGVGVAGDLEVGKGLSATCMQNTNI